MRFFDPLLYPFALVYEGITRLRNRMFDLGMKKSVGFLVPTIVVGNLSMGGTGKTPMVEFLIKKLKDRYKIATLSRGYGRGSRGFLLAHSGSSAKDLGDEPFQIYQKFGAEVTVAVGEERILAIPHILAEKPATELILLDDAFQHRYVLGDLYILLTTFQKPFFRDRLLPLGTLREHPKGARRAQAVLVTKCPAGLDQRTQGEYTRKIKEYAGGDCLVFFAGLKYGQPYGIFDKSLQISEKVILLSGIADNQLLKEAVDKKYELLETYEFPDHHRYSVKEMQNIVNAYGNYKSAGCSIITTEKDAVKLKAFEFLKEIPIFALPVEISMDASSEKDLLNLTAKAIAKKSKS